MQSVYSAAPADQVSEFIIIALTLQSTQKYTYFPYLGSNTLSTEGNFNIRKEKAWTAIDW